MLPMNLKAQPRMNKADFIKGCQQGIYQNLMNLEIPVNKKVYIKGSYIMCEKIYNMN